MTARVTMIHTVASNVGVFRELARELLPGVEVRDLVDEALLGEAVAAGGVPDATAARLADEVTAALADGSDMVVVTCSSMGRAVDAIRERTGAPVLRIDEAMADQAIGLARERGMRIGIIATLATTLEPTAELIRQRAADVPVTVVPLLVEGAFASLESGDREAHDEAVRTGIRDLLSRVDLIVLAQASMARVVATLGADAAAVPILSSPRLGIARVAALLAADGRLG